MRKSSDIILVVATGAIFLLPATNLLALVGFTGLGPRSILLLWGGVFGLFVTLLSRVSDMQSLQSVGQRIAGFYKRTAVLALNAVVIFACMDLLARALLKGQDLLMLPNQQRVIDDREKSSYYTTQDWAIQFWNEFALSRNHLYHPYVLWRRGPFTGRTINIDRDGIRSTPGAQCTAKSFKVFAFGSSSMWGTGSPDWATIPAYLQAGLEKLRHGPICVVNFGENGYVSTQSLVQLLLELQSGNVPDLALFYDGQTDVYSGYQSGRAGLHENLDSITARLERSEPPINPLIILLKSSHLYALLQGLVARLTEKPQTSPALITYETMGIDAATLSNSIAQRYLSNYKMVDALAQKYGFRYFFFLPPHISDGEKPLTSEEEQIKRGVEPALAKLYRSVYQTIELVAPEYKNLFVMVNIFDRYKPLLWIDDSHVTPVGNQLIAQEMLKVLTARNLLSNSLK